MENYLHVVAVSAGVIAFVAAIFLLLQSRKLRRQKEIADNLRSENDRLLPYAKIAEAEREARRIMDAAHTAESRMRRELEAQIQEARDAVSAARDQAKAIMDVARIQASRIVEGAKAEHAETLAAGKIQAADVETRARTRADELLETARRQVVNLITSAERKAEETAGQALRAVREAERLDGVVKALKNRIEGYGDEYLIPGVTLLDRLADDYDFSLASRDYKLVKEQVKRMMRDGQAATCDYVEASRRETAIRFVADAFNGKVETALSRLRHDNYGKLRQEILDAFALVNLNGQAFRSARVEAEYLELRLKELRLGTVLQEMKLADMAEQKRIKDQIREEQRAQREFERALRDATKEEDALKKAMEKVRGAYDVAGQEQKQKYETQLREMEQRLAEAEARNQRALSMAQQTRTGHVYVISNVGSFGENIFKIGMTRRLEPLDRVRELGDASVPFEFDVHAMIFSENAPALERDLQKRFFMQQVNKVNLRKEFFRVSLTDLRKVVEEQNVGTIHWTLTAEARHYRETLALEQRLASDPFARQAWLAEQRARLELPQTVYDECEVEGDLVA